MGVAVKQKQIRLDLSRDNLVPYTHTRFLAKWHLIIVSGCVLPSDDPISHSLRSTPPSMLVQSPDCWFWERKFVKFLLKDACSFAHCFALLELKKKQSTLQLWLWSGLLIFVLAVAMQSASACRATYEWGCASKAEGPGKYLILLPLDDRNLHRKQKCKSNHSDAGSIYTRWKVRESFKRRCRFATKFNA